MTSLEGSSPPSASRHLNIEQGTGNDEYRRSSLEGSSRQPSTTIEPRSHESTKKHEEKAVYLLVLLSSS